MYCVVSNEKLDEPDGQTWQDSRRYMVRSLFSPQKAEASLRKLCELVFPPLPMVGGTRLSTYLLWFHGKEFIHFFPLPQRKKWALLLPTIAKHTLQGQRSDVASEYLLLHAKQWVMLTCSCPFGGFPKLHVWALLETGHWTRWALDWSIRTLLVTILLSSWLLFCSIWICK